MRKISTRIKRILTSNLGLKIVSVLVACMMWIFVVNVDDPEKVQSFSDVKVEIRNSDCFGVDKTFSVQEDTDKVKVWVKARESVLNKLQSKDFKVVADMRNVRSAMQCHIHWNVPAVRSPRQTGSVNRHP